jgi:hypothetical protein
MLSVFHYMCKQLAYLVLSRIFILTSKIDELLRGYPEHFVKNAGKQEDNLRIAALVKCKWILYHRDKIQQFDYISDKLSY